MTLHVPGPTAAKMALASLFAATPAVALPPAPPTMIGMNMPQVSYYSNTAPFANLVIGSAWVTDKWSRLPSEYINRNGDVLSLPAEGVALRILTIPGTGPQGEEIVCTYSGSGNLSAGGVIEKLENFPHKLKFRITNTWTRKVSAWLILTNVNPRQPFRDLDCRGASVPRTTRFRTSFVETLRGYGVLRFMDWQNANQNVAVAWADRHLPTGIEHDADGISIEDMLALSKAAGADPWFVMPWNASDEYIDSFARLVRASLPAGHHVYVETGNEVWNSGFNVSKQATKEGLDEKLSKDPWQANQMRYAERSIQVMKIWERAFAESGALVRVVSVQNVSPTAAQEVLKFRDMAAHADALASAPYFGGLIGGHAVGTPDEIIAKLRLDLVVALQHAKNNRAVAASYHKRYIAYEGGQGLELPGEPDIFQQVERDGRMYDLYKAYLIGWKRDIGDVLCLLTLTAPISTSGAWGLNEHEGQSPSEAPKLRAVLEER